MKPWPLYQKERNRYPRLSGIDGSRAGLEVLEDD